MIQERLKALRAEMEKRGITVYVVPTADFHESEYVGDHFKARKFITDLPVLRELPLSLWMRQGSGRTDAILYRQRIS